VVCKPNQPISEEEDNPRCTKRGVPPASGSGDAERRPLTLPEAAGYLNVSERYMRRLVAERRIPYFKVGRLLRFSAADLDAFMAACRVEPPPLHPLLRPRRRSSSP
jgi:excisionase family DNA binding protein